MMNRVWCWNSRCTFSPCHPRIHFPFWHWTFSHYPNRHCRITSAAGKINQSEVPCLKCATSCYIVLNIHLTRGFIYHVHSRENSTNLIAQNCLLTRFRPSTNLIPMQFCTCTLSLHSITGEYAYLTLICKQISRFLVIRVSVLRI